MNKNSFHSAIIFSAIVFINACNYSVNDSSKKEYTSDSSVYERKITAEKIIDSLGIIKNTAIVQDKKPGALEQSIINAGLVNIKDVDSTIIVDLKYSTVDNFLGIDVYGDLENAYLQRDVAEKLAVAQQLLKNKNSAFSLIVYDAVRPRSIQYLMWDTIKVSEAEKPKYLSNPKYGSLHNYGAAVDVSIVDVNGNAIDMGTEYDYFGELAHPEKEEVMLKQRKLTKQQINNRKLLRSVMSEAGFFNIQTEWWHFNSCYRKEAMLNYKIVE